MTRSLFAFATVFAASFALLSASAKDPDRPALGEGAAPTRAEVRDRIKGAADALGERREAGFRGTTAQGEGRNAALATWLALGNHNEVELGKLAQQKATNSEVKNFAQQMVDEHQKFLAKLQNAGASTSQLATKGERARDEQGQNPARASYDPASAPERSNDLLAIKQEIAQECLKSSKEALNELSGAEFDKAYVGMQVGKHMEMLDTLRVFQKHANGELAQVIGHGIKTTEQHLQHAKSICKQLESRTN